MLSPSLYITNFADERCRFDSYSELNFNGVYWNRAEEKWWNMCGQGEFEPWSPVEVHSAALYGTRPETETGETGRTRWW